MSESVPEGATNKFKERHFSETMNNLGERRLAQGIFPNMKHLWLEAKDRTEMEIDEKTGLLNKPAYEMRKRNLLKLAKRFGMKLVLLRFDVNELKPINDIEGHIAGDRVLEDAGRTISEVLRETDLGGRVGGDEFEAIIVGAGLEDARKIWNLRLLPQFNLRKVKISAGASEVDTSSEATVEESTELADDAQSKAKIASRESHQSEFRTTGNLTKEDIMNRKHLRKTAERKTAA